MLVANLGERAVLMSGSAESEVWISSEGAA